jgi:predicted nucleic acid-binding protein
MTRYFVDTWYFIALTDRFDQGHAAARRLEQSLILTPLVSHDGVFMEMLAYFGGSGANMRQRAVTIVRRTMRGMKVIQADRDLFLSGLKLYERRLDKEYSLVDCMSMELMRARGIQHILTNDHHFRQEGFAVLSDAP